MNKPEPLYKVGERVKYQGSDENHFWRTYTIEGGIQYRPEFDPPGHYYDLTHWELKRVHESELHKLKPDETADI